jgi:hypothetical protein
VFRRPAVVIAVAALLTVPTATAPVATSAPTERRHPSSAVLDWERISMLTIYGPGATPPPPPRTPIPVGVLYLGFVSLAMHDAAEASSRRAWSSETAAVAAAAHRVLRKYYPSSRPDLTAALEETLSGVPDGPAEDTGVEIGRQAAGQMIRSRADDGRDDTSIEYDKPERPGFWQPPEGGSMLAPWLGSVDPLVLDGVVPVNGPDRLASDAYARDYDQALRLGSADSEERTSWQTATAQFYNSNSAIMVGEALVDLLEAEPMKLRRTARLFAVMHAAMADSVIRCWELKRDVGFWRPVQAIDGANLDGNPDTEPADEPWVPLITNPPYSDYVSGHASLTAPAVQTLRMMMGEDTHLTLHSYSTGTDRVYSSLEPIERQAFRARIWGGLHFRDAMQDGYAMGHATARRVRAALR